MSLPLGTSFRCQDFVDNMHPNYMGEVFKVMAFVKGVDVEVAGFL